MPQKKVDNRIRVLIENGVKTGHRSMFIIVGDKAKDQIFILHHMLSKSVVRARPNILWCYKKDLGFSSHRKKRMRVLSKKIKSGRVDMNEDDPFELFIASTNIRYCYYSETHKILGNTFGMLILQDFEALTPNLLARTVETVEGGGLVVFLLKTMDSLQQLYTMSMDVHSRFRTEACQDVVGRFNERFLLSVVNCSSCIIMDDSLGILPLSKCSATIKPVEIPEERTKAELLLGELKGKLQDTPIAGALVALCKTSDQAASVMNFIEVISEKNPQFTVSLTAGRGRGKSAALGLAVAAAIACGYSNIYVTSPSPENLKTFFEFLIKGFEALLYAEHTDFEITESTEAEHSKAIVRISFFKDHRQYIQYISPGESEKLGQCELLVIDEAAAIPLPLVKKLLGPHLVFLASTINGYEGTGRALSLKLLGDLRKQSSINSDSATKSSKFPSQITSRVLREIVLEESVRYKPNDPIERWLSELLCLEATETPELTSGCPDPNKCELYYINRDTLFCYHQAAEVFLHRVWSLFVSSHYKNSPNDLQMLSDAPAHHVFCLLGPTDAQKSTLPDVLAVIQVCLEGEISKESINRGLARGQRASGDLIPWTMAQQFQDPDFPSLSGARIVRIAVHPDHQSMGYGSRAMKLLQDYYEHKFVNLDETPTPLNIPRSISKQDKVSIYTEKIEPKESMPPLLAKLSERPPEPLHYLGVSYGLTLELLKFWKRIGFVPTYLRQTRNDLTGEHSCIMLKLLESETKSENGGKWLEEYWKDFRRRFLSLLSYQFRVFSPSLALSLIQTKNKEWETPEDIGPTELKFHVTPYDIKRLEMYVKNMADYHLIMDLVPTMSRLYFLNKLGSVRISIVQSAILLALGLQSKTVDESKTEVGLEGTQILGLFNKTIRRLLTYMTQVLESEVEESLSSKSKSLPPMLPLGISLNEELESGAAELKRRQEEELGKLKKTDLSQYAIKGGDELWQAALSTSKGKMKTLSAVSIKTGEKRVGELSGEGTGKKSKSEDFGKGWKKNKKGHKNKSKSK